VAAPGQISGGSWGYGNILKAIRSAEGEAIALPEALQKANIGGAAAEDSVKNIFRALKESNQNFSAKFIGGKYVRVNLLEGGSETMRSVTGANFTIPIESQGRFAWSPEMSQSTGYAQTAANKEAHFISRQRFARVGPESVQPMTGLQSLAHTMSRDIRTADTSTPGRMRNLARTLQGRFSNEYMKNLVWTGFKPLAEGGGPTGQAYKKMGSIYDVFQMGVVGVTQGPGIGAGRVIQEVESKFPFVGGKFQPGNAWQQIEEYQKTLTGLGLNLSDEAVKAEHVLGGNIGVWKLGDIVPFGGSGDPSRQAYQRWGISQLAPVAKGARGARRFDPLTTKARAAAEQFISRTEGGGTGRWGALSKVALVMDPRFEAAVAGSAGGAVVSREFASQMTADITQFAQYDSSRWGKLQDPKTGRYLSEMVVGTPFISSMGSKHTVASILEKMSGAQVAVGWSTFLAGKNPEALRDAVFRDIMDQSGAYERAIGRTSKGTFRKLSPGQISKRKELLNKLFGKMTSAIGGGAELNYLTGEYGVRGIVPQIRTGAASKFGAAEMGSVQVAIDEYNKALKTDKVGKMNLGLSRINDMFRVGELKAGGETFKSMFLTASFMRRLEMQEVVTKAVGHWTRPSQASGLDILLGRLSELDKPDVGRAGEQYWSKGQDAARTIVNRLYHPRGVKMGPRDIINLRMYQSKEADRLADYYERIIKGWGRKEKTELGRIWGSWSPKGEKGFQKLSGSLSLEDMAKKYGNYKAAPGGAAKLTMEELGGTIFGETSPLRKQGVAFKLGEAIEIGAIKDQAGRVVERGVKSREFYLPALEFYRGVMPAVEEGLGSDIGMFRDKLVRAHESAFLSLASTNPDHGQIEKRLNQYYNLLGSGFTDKTGVYSYLSTARMAQSGYLSLVPGGETRGLGGKVAKALGTGLDDPFTALISPETAKEMGVYKHFLDTRGRATRSLYGRTTAWPGIGPTMEHVLRFKLAKEGELGRNSLRISQLVALTMFRDFDADKAGVTFLTGKNAQELSKAMYEKTSIPRLKGYSQLAKIDPTLKNMVDESAGASKEISDAIQAARREGKDIRHSTLIKMADIKTQSIHARIAKGTDIAAKYGTKALTPTVNWYMQQFRTLSTQKAMVGDLREMGILGASERLSGALGGIFGIIEQQTAIAKSGTESQGAIRLFELMNTSWDPKASPDKFNAAAAEAHGLVVKLTGAKPGASGREIYQALKGRGEPFTVGGRGAAAGVLGRESTAINAMKQMLGVGAVRQRGQYPEIMKQFSKGREGFMAAFHGLEGVLDIYERASTESGVRTAYDQSAKLYTDMAGLGKVMGFSEATSVDEAAKALQAREYRIAEQAVSNDSIKQAGAAAKTTVLDRATGWWTNTKTPYWQKAGVITGAAIILGAVAKSTLLGGYGPEGPPRMTADQVMGPPPPVIMAALPIPMGGGPWQPPEMPYNLGKKPGGLFAYVSDQVGFDSEHYGQDSPTGMWPVKPSFGPRVNMSGFGLDIGPGIADSEQRPLILTGPPVGGGSPMQPAMAAMGRSKEQMPYISPTTEPPAMVSLPEYMRGGVTIEATQPEGSSADDDIESIMSEALGMRVDLTSNRWDPNEGTIQRMMDSRSSMLSSFT